MFFYFGGSFFQLGASKQSMAHTGPPATAVAVRDPHLLAHWKVVGNSTVVPLPQQQLWL